MITGVPTADGLHDTAIGWLNLACTAVLDCLTEIREHKEHIEEINGQWGDSNPVEIANIVRGQRYKINNGLSLLQQSLELFLKARIALVSPFLLISGEARSWPRLKADNSIDFAEFRTIDATDLCRVVNIVSEHPLPKGFAEVYSSLRTRRNRIVHLDDGSIVNESAKVLVDILEAHALLFPSETWQAFRQRHLWAREEDALELYGQDISHDIYLSEIDTMIDSLAPEVLRKHLQLEKRKRFLSCPNCKNLVSKYFTGECEYAQKKKDGSIFCTACATTYADAATLAEFADKV